MTGEDIAPEEHALGVLSGESYAAAVGRAMVDPAFAASSASLEMKLAGLTARLADAEPDRALWARIAERIAKPVPAMILLRTTSEPWTERTLGVDVKVLRWDQETGARAIMLRMAPGAVLPDHDHDGDEEVFMLSGDLMFDDLLLGAGDYLRMPAGSHHTVGRSPSGCVAIVVTHGKGA
ncbi:MAG: cupin domain-containing protein [Beijerinckiaceae bacterium]